MYVYEYQILFFLVILIFAIVSTFYCAAKNEINEKKVEYLSKENRRLKKRLNILMTEIAKRNFNDFERKNQND